jgi:hypothetical protein
MNFQQSKSPLGITKTKRRFPPPGRVCRIKPLDKPLAEPLPMGEKGRQRALRICRVFIARRSECPRLLLNQGHTIYLKAERQL